MSREAYQPPTAINQPGSSGFNQQSSQGQGGQGGQQSGFGGGAGGGFAETNQRPVTYLCGDCNAKIPLRRKDPIRCKECGHRVLYKERTSRSKRGDGPSKRRRRYYGG